jgi:alpha,alpha-trehalose phosphorylase
MRSYAGRLSFAPRLPSRIDRLTFSVRWRGLRLRVTVRAKEATYELRPGSGDNHDHEVKLTLRHHGQEFTASSAGPVTMPVPVAPQVTAPTQPVGREPVRRDLRT